MMMLLFLIMLLAEFYLVMKFCSFIESDLYWKYRLLGPFALFIPGVLKPGGSKYVLAAACGAIILFATGLYVFEMSDLVRG